jgi:hypothetical protein
MLLMFLRYSMHIYRIRCSHLQVGAEFNFADFVKDFLAEEFAKIVRLEVLMWIIAIIWISFPDGSYAGFWLNGIFAVVSIAAGAKLHVIAMHLARHAYGMFFRPELPNASFEASSPHSSFSGVPVARLSDVQEGDNERTLTATGRADLASRHTGYEIAGRTGQNATPVAEGVENTHSNVEHLISEAVVGHRLKSDADGSRSLPLATLGRTCTPGSCKACLARSWTQGCHHQKQNRTTSNLARLASSGTGDPGRSTACRGTAVAGCLHCRRAAPEQGCHHSCIGMQAHLQVEPGERRLLSKWTGKRWGGGGLSKAVGEASEHSGQEGIGSRRVEDATVLHESEARVASDAADGHEGGRVEGSLHESQRSRIEGALDEPVPRVNVAPAAGEASSGPGRSISEACNEGQRLVTQPDGLQRFVSYDDPATMRSIEAPEGQAPWAIDGTTGQASLSTAIPSSPLAPQSASTERKTGTVSGNDVAHTQLPDRATEQVSTASSRGDTMHPSGSALSNAQLADESRFEARLARSRDAHSAAARMELERITEMLPHEELLLLQNIPKAEVLPQETPSSPAVQTTGRNAKEDVTATEGDKTCAFAAAMTRSRAAHEAARRAEMERITEPEAAEVASEVRRNSVGEMARCTSSLRSPTGVVLRSEVLPEACQRSANGAPADGWAACSTRQAAGTAPPPSSRPGQASEDADAVNVPRHLPEWVNPSVLWPRRHRSPSTAFAERPLPREHEADLRRHASLGRHGEAISGAEADVHVATNGKLAPPPATERSQRRSHVHRGLKRPSVVRAGAEAVLRIGQANTKEVARLLRGHSQRVLMQKVDFEKLFWFRSPVLMLRIFQYCFFENALSLAVVAFAFWQHESSMFAGVGTASELNAKALAVTLSLLALDLLLLFHNAAFVLPVYALTRASVMYCRPKGALEYAKKHGIRPDLVGYLEETDGMVRRGL